MTKIRKRRQEATAPRGLSSPWRRPLPTPRLVSGAPHSAGPQALMHSCTPRHRFSNRHRESHPSLGSQQSWALVPDPPEIRVSYPRGGAGRAGQSRPVISPHPMASRKPVRKSRLVGSALTGVCLQPLSSSHLWTLDGGRCSEISPCSRSTGTKSPRPSCSCLSLCLPQGFPGGSDREESACNAEDPGSVPGSGRSSGEGNSNQLQYSCLENHGQRSLVGYSP